MVGYKIIIPFLCVAFVTDVYYIQKRMRRFQYTSLSIDTKSWDHKERKRDAEPRP